MLIRQHNQIRRCVQHGLFYTVGGDGVFWSGAEKKHIDGHSVKLAYVQSSSPAPSSIDSYNFRKISTKFSESGSELGGVCGAIVLSRRALSIHVIFAALMKIAPNQPPELCRTSPPKKIDSFNLTQKNECMIERLCHAVQTGMKLYISLRKNQKLL